MRNKTVNFYQTFLIDTPVSSSGSPTDNLFVDNLNVNNISTISGSNINYNANLIPTNDGQYYIGTNIKRWRELNVLSGQSTYWTSNTMDVDVISGDTINLGFDSIAYEYRILDKDTSILKNDILNGGVY